MFAALLPFFAAAFTPRPPTTVNEQVLGTAKDFATSGPARVCLKDMVVSPKAGETLYVEYLGIHDARLRLLLADGTHLLLTQGDSFRDQRRSKQEPVIERLTQRYYLVGDQEGPRYQMVSLEGDSGESPYVLFLSGTALSGDQSDKHVFDRLTFPLAKEQQCDRRFGYGWDGVFWTTSAGPEAK